MARAARAPSAARGRGHAGRTGGAAECAPLASRGAASMMPPQRLQRRGVSAAAVWRAASGMRGAALAGTTASAARRAAPALDAWGPAARATSAHERARATCVPRALAPTPSRAVDRGSSVRRRSRRGRGAEAQCARRCSPCAAVRVRCYRVVHCARKLRRHAPAAGSPQACAAGAAGAAGGRGRRRRRGAAADADKSRRRNTS